MSLSLPNISTSEHLYFAKFPSALIPGVFIEWVERHDHSRLTRSEEGKLHGRIEFITPSAHINIIVLQYPNRFSAAIQRRIGPLRHSTTKHIPELVITSETRQIQHEQVLNVVNAFDAKDAVEGGMRLSRMRDYYIIRYSLDKPKVLQNTRTQKYRILRTYWYKAAPKKQPRWALERRKFHRSF